MGGQEATEHYAPEFVVRELGSWSGNVPLNPSTDESAFSLLVQELLNNPYVVLVNRKSYIHGRAAFLHNGQFEIDQRPRRRAMRFSMGGWVLNSADRPPPEKGLTMNRCAVAGEAFMGTRLFSASSFVSASVSP